jgi:hypothetical protein
MKYFVILLTLGILINMVFLSSYAQFDEFGFVGLNDSYSLGEEFSIVFQKTTRQPCPSYEISLMKEGIPESEIYYGAEPLCAISGPVEPYLFSGTFEKPEFFDSIGTYSIKITLDNETINKKIQITHHEFSYIPSPLKQMQLGIKFHKVECNDGLVLAKRGNSERSACVTPDTKIELTIRGWADDDRILLGCTGERVQKCYPEDKEEYRKKLQKYYYGFNEEPDSKIDVACMPMEASKSTATFFKIPSYLPEDYSFKCSFSGTPYESYLIFDNKKVPDGWISHYPELVSDGAIFIYQTDQKNAVGEKKFATYGTATQRIQDTYDDVLTKNPSLQPQLIRINGMLAYAVDSCNDCGMQTANFTDGTVIKKSTSSEAKIKFIDENGTSYLLKAGIPLSELIKVAESLQ